MFKKILPAIATIGVLASCSSIKPLNFTSNNQLAPSVTSDPKTNGSETTKEKKPKFLEEIAVTPQLDAWSAKPKPLPDADKDSKLKEKAEVSSESGPMSDGRNTRTSAIENASEVQLKYAVLLNTEVEYLPNKQLLENVDDWYGVRYRVGGNTKKGIDCSGFTVAIYTAVYGLMLPRVSREQYRTSRKISTTELKEGDLVFFDTRGRGSVSHVGIYLGNNKFIHASVSKGVMVNGLFEPYYLRRFVGAGRIDNKSFASTTGSQLTD